MNRTAWLAAAAVGGLIGASASADIVTLTVTGTVESTEITHGEFAGAAPGDAVELIIDVDTAPLGMPCCDPDGSGTFCCELVELYNVDDDTMELTVFTQAGPETIFSNYRNQETKFWLGNDFAGQDSINTFVTRMGIENYRHSLEFLDQTATVFSSIDVHFFPAFVPASAMQDGGVRVETGQTFPIWEVEYVDSVTGQTELMTIDFDGGIAAEGVTEPVCACETDNSAGVNVFDLLAYLDQWFASDAAADIDGAAGVDVFDLLAFLDCWFPASAGEPCV
jgi:hypothetical protein